MANRLPQTLRRLVRSAARGISTAGTGWTAPLDEVFDGVRAVAYGWRTEWCAACHLCHEDGDSFVPDF
ncbi:hypothetical protein ACIP98_41290 [Streptomyces sp. NPDC088354]|uniref:hypothetical protein n=1 Tax=Streptomyces sp. NPDC088354 TaxID=3365856 RepID=UPI00381552AC